MRTKNVLIPRKEKAFLLESATETPPMDSKMRKVCHQNEDEESDETEVVLSNKGGPKIIHKNFMYTLHKKQPYNIRWRCVARSYFCRGSLITTVDCGKPRVQMEHNHEPDYIAVKASRRRYIDLGKPPITELEEYCALQVNKQEQDESGNSQDDLFEAQEEKVDLNEMPVLQSHQREKSSFSTKSIRVPAQTYSKQMRNVAPTNLAPSSANQQGQQQHQQQPKTLVLKTIPLKVKQVAPTTIKMPPRQTAQGIPQNTVPQQSAEVCLRWNSYHSNMQNSFPSLLDSEQFVDVTLACEGRSLKCHKMILSTCSDYLAELLRENPCQHPIILMKDLKFWEIEALVKFMYRGEVNVAHEKLPQLLNAAEALQIKGLAGPSSQNSRPPLLIPPTKSQTQSVCQRLPETKESRPSTSSGFKTASPKRAQKRRTSDSMDTSKPFAKRPATPESPNAMVKIEPLDIPLSPFADNNLMGLDPGGSIHDSEDRDMNFGGIDGPPDLTDGEDQMEFVPTDFLDQEHDIVEDVEPDSCLSERDESRKSDNSDDCVSYQVDENSHLLKEKFNKRDKFEEIDKPPTEKLMTMKKDKV